MSDDNKYIFDIDALIKEENEEMKEERKKKHRKSRVLSWVFLLLFAAAIIGAAAFFITKYLLPFDSSDKDSNTSATELVKDLVDELPVPDAPDENNESIVHEDDVVISNPEPVVIEPTADELLEEAIREYINSMTLEDRVAGIFIVTPEGLTGVGTVTRAGDGTKTALEKYAVGGIIYSAKNMTGVDQFKTVIENTKTYARYPLFLAVDEELGASTFGKNLKVASTQTAAEIGAGGDAAIAKVEEEKIAKYMSEYGLNLNTGIVADVLTDADNTVMSTRSFGSDLNLTSEMSAYAVSALINAGLYSGVKFFPGQGFATADTSNGLSVSARTRAEMEECEFISFKAAIDAGATMLMVSHVSAPDLTGDNTPCSLSKTVMTDLIRKEWGYDNLILITDSLSKAAISSYYESSEACIMAIKAGADMVLCPENFEESYAAVLDAVNKNIIAAERIEDSLVRIYRQKFKDLTPDEIKALIK